MICGDTTIDGLLAGDRSIKPLVPGAQSPAVGHLQDLLRGHGYSFVPDPRSPSYRSYDSATGLAITNYRRKNGLIMGDRAGSGLIRDLVSRPAAKAAVNPAYVPLVLDVALTPVLRFVWLTSLFETGGVLGTLNLNTDRCGVSFGILQWSQRPGRLNEILQGCATRESAEWARIMGSTTILDYTAKPNGGLDARGLAIDAAFELTKEPWKSKLQALGASLAMQRVQLDIASEAYLTELRRQIAYASAIASERGFAFILDLANQFGRARVQRQYELAARPGAGEREILKTLEEAFVGIARLPFQPQVRARREFFRTTSMLSDQPLQAGL